MHSDLIKFVESWIDGSGNVDPNVFRQKMTQHHSPFEAAEIRKVIADKIASSLDTDKDKRLFLGALTLFEACEVKASLFFPSDQSLQSLLNYLDWTRKTMDICVFTITDDRIASRIFNAVKRGVKVRVVADDEKAHDQGSDVARFAAAGIPVRTDNSMAHMHNKFCVLDGRIVITGSFNWTVSASRQNQENVVILDESAVVTRFHQEFERLWADFAKNALY
mmetsp:Transcript_23569/g.40538  ORF Transcript_23569/g.40538 Transcript_23569/m.40538 type:complete len:221 (+) Transcript_23569:135-797(+)